MAAATMTAVVTLSSATITSATAILSTAAAAQTTASSKESEPAPEDENGECQLLGPFSIFIQGALGLLALLSLVYKRWRERPQRPIKIWAFDVSKQVVGSMLLHLVNLLMSIMSSGQLTAVPSAKHHDTSNPCSFYLLNLAIDTTVGVAILILFLRVLTYGATRTPIGRPPESISSGNYGQPPKASWWLKQSLIYFIGLLGMKLCVFLIFKLCPWLISVGNWALRWTEGNEQLQVFFVMLFFPLIMNAIQYYVIDGFIKGKTPSSHEPVSTEDDLDEDDEATQRLTNAWDASFDSEDEADVVKKRNRDARESSRDRRQNIPLKSSEFEDYNPERDGDNDARASSSGINPDENDAKVFNGSKS